MIQDQDTILLMSAVFDQAVQHAPPAYWVVDGVHLRLKPARQLCEGGAVHRTPFSTADGSLTGAGSWEGTDPAGAGEVPADKPTR